VNLGRVSIYLIFSLNTLVTSNSIWLSTLLPYFGLIDFW
jgi:hypothetical protein